MSIVRVQEQVINQDFPECNTTQAAAISFSKERSLEQVSIIHKVE